VITGVENGFHIYKMQLKFLYPDFGASFPYAATDFSWLPTLHCFGLNLGAAANASLSESGFTGFEDLRDDCWLPNFSFVFAGGFGGSFLP
jgi:hypothetical protein